MRIRLQQFVKPSQISLQSNKGSGGFTLAKKDSSTLSVFNRGLEVVQ